MATATTLFLRGTGNPTANAAVGDAFPLPSCDKGRLLVQVVLTDRLAFGTSTPSYDGHFRVTISGLAPAFYADAGPDGALADQTFGADEGEISPVTTIMDLDDLLWPANVANIYWEPDASNPTEAPPAYQSQMWFTYIP